MNHDYTAWYSHELWVYYMISNEPMTIKYDTVMNNDYTAWYSHELWVYYMIQTGRPFKSLSESFWMA